MVFKEFYDENIKIICANGFKHYCYPILVGVIIDYKEQVFITRIKTNMQYSVCLVSLQ